MARIPTHKQAYTLVELVLGLSISTVLLGGMTSVMMLSAKALPSPDDPAQAVARAGATVGQISQELHTAQSFSERLTNAVTFTVPDRDNDGFAETIRYAWSGTAGQPLTRQYNADTPAPLVASVYDFQVDYGLATVSNPGDVVPTESGLTQLFAYDSVTNLSNFAVKDEEWPGQYFKPSLPAEALTWRVKEVAVRTRYHGVAHGSTALQLRTANADYTPTSTVLQQTTIDESVLFSFYAWNTYAFSTPADLAPGDGFCLVLKWLSDADSCDVEYQSGSVAIPDTSLVETSNGGASWDAKANKALRFKVFGTVTTNEPGAPINTYYLTSVRVLLRTDDDAATAVETAVPILNSPEVLGL